MPSDVATTVQIGKKADRMWFHDLYSMRLNNSSDEYVLKLTCNQECDHVVDDVVVRQSLPRLGVFAKHHCVNQVSLVCRVSSSLLDYTTRDGLHEIDALPIPLGRLSVEVVGCKYGPRSSVA